MSKTEVNATRDEAVKFEGIAAYKLQSLKDRGWQVCGVAIRNPESGAYGFVTDGAFVGWWLPEYYPNHTEGDTPPSGG